MESDNKNYIKLPKIQIMNGEKNNFDCVTIWFSGGGWGKAYEHSAFIMLRRLHELFDLKNKLHSEINTDGEKNHLNYYVVYNENQIRKIVELLTKLAYEITVNNKERLSFKLPEAISINEFEIWKKDEETKDAKIRSFLNVPHGKVEIYIAIKDMRDEMLLLIKDLPKEVRETLGSSALSLIFDLYNEYFALTTGTIEAKEVVKSMNLIVERIVFLIGGFYENEMTKGVRIIKIGGCVLVLKKALAAL